jgi:hypothetical protein
MKRFSTLTLVGILALMFSACSDSPTTSTITLGKTSLDDFFANPSWNSWFQTNYSTYPDAASQDEFQQYVDEMKATIDPAEHRMIMVTKPSCGCQDTRLWMPRVFKALDAAGFPRENIELYVTDARLAGIDELKAKYTINEAPVFIVLKNDVVKGRIDKAPDPADRVEQELAQIFAIQ